MLLMDLDAYRARDNTQERWGVGRVLVTDYERYAVVYECSEPRGDGSCAAHAATVIVYSRTRAMLDERALADVVPQMSGIDCLKREDFEQVPQDGKSISLVWA